MELIDLVLTVCLAADPGNCRIERIHFESRGSLMQCILHAPPEIAKWAQDHPTLKVVRWTCSYPGHEREA
jgi:hypothetical protein